jgi:hypothetical protein
MGSMQLPRLAIIGVVALAGACNIEGGAASADPANVG